MSNFDKQPLDSSNTGKVDKDQDFDFAEDLQEHDKIQAQNEFRNSVKNFFAKHGFVLFLLGLVILSLGYSNYSMKKDFSTELAKRDMAYDNLKEIAQKQSEIEVFGSLADTHKQNAESLLLEINETYEKAKQLEKDYETEILKKNCLKAQIDRMVEGQDYSKEYCDETQNLENFRSVK